jgi:hypothetical protein
LGLPIGTSGVDVAQLADAQKLLEKNQKRPVSTRHCNAESESQPLGSVHGEALLLTLDVERALPGDESAKHEAQCIPARSNEGGASRNRTDDLHDAIVALYQLSYSPVWERKRTGLESLVKPLADHAHDTIVTRGCQGPAGEGVSSDTSAKMRSASRAQLGR